jgi:hypothetical protein
MPSAEKRGVLIERPSFLLFVAVGGQKRWVEDITMVADALDAFGRRQRTRRRVRQQGFVRGVGARAVGTPEREGAGGDRKRTQGDREALVLAGEELPGAAEELARMVTDHQVHGGPRNLKRPRHSVRYARQ